MQDATELVERIISEGPIGLSTAARLYGSYRAGRPTSPSTVHRHHTKGIPLGDGTVVRLEAIKVAGRIMTSRAAVVRFFARQNDPTNPQPASPIPTRRSQHACASAAERELDALGVK